MLDWGDSCGLPEARLWGIRDAIDLTTVQTPKQRVRSNEGSAEDVLNKGIRNYLPKHVLMKQG